ncbi:VWA domain-containing protein [Pontibacterium granulatum]|uniref:VWA domain-containing protein n=1 Tax=Pontibacterium granulatum TaxID=2036029 RepID=UPI00249AD02E|nr:VWA domain-containing protein [Pontibacterium granulatum]MDI3323400.1 VWA domain-containing protein [Pontibacterium granulatum]
MLSRFDDAYSQLDLLPEALLPTVVTHPHGEFQSRVEGVLQLRHALLLGKLPTESLPWPAVPIQQQLNKTLRQLDLPRFCRENEEVVDALLADVLLTIEELQPSFLKTKLVLALEYQKAELNRLKEELSSRKRKRRKQPSVKIPAEKLAELDALSEVKGWISFLSAEGLRVPDVWHERLSIWGELEAVFRDLQLVTSLGFDLSKGLFQSHGWLNLVKLREVLKTLPQLQDVIRTIGRMKSADGALIVESILQAIRVSRMRDREIKSPLIPMETRGVTRSDSISRMLPQEAAYLGHPVLKGLWHARRAEHALLSYAVEGTELEAVEEEQEVLSEVQRVGKKRNEERGPMIICLDTSGSMRGTPENVAKALVLECLSVSAQEKRGCYVYLFGSRNEVKELELSPNEQGLERLISFLSMSFGGGTDVEGPLQMALEKCKQKQWERADILLVTDGEFACPDNLVSKIKRRKKSHALAVHGVLIGEHSQVMERLCDPLHMFSDWLELAP